MQAVGYQIYKQNVLTRSEDWEMSMAVLNAYSTQRSSSE